MSAVYPIRRGRDAPVFTRNLLGGSRESLPFPCLAWRGSPADLSRRAVSPVLEQKVEAQQRSLAPVGDGDGCPWSGECDHRGV
ncbi:MAG TPA: hypothetical protein VMU54_12240, partial [Planctomycetota bacterium]|nr:hypothetical protein [Planctomycetota bacterium]